MPIHTFNPQNILSMLNELEKKLLSIIPAPGPGIRITRNESGILISADSSGSGNQPIYTGMLKVTLENGNLKIRDGMDPTASVAGFLYYNQIYRECPAAELSPSDGFLCVRCNSAGSVGYEIKQTPPNMPILQNATDDDTAYYPIARIKSEGNSYTIRQLLRYSPPILTAWGPCD